jgi:hypothetical protein
MDESVANRVRPTLGAGLGGKQARGPGREWRETLNTPNPVQTESSSSQLSDWFKVRRRVEGWDRVEGREGIIDSTKRLRVGQRWDLQNRNRGQGN